MPGREEYVDVGPDVARALGRGGAVVALESTLISHGLPRPENLALAREVEGIVREEGAIPATIGVIGGVAKVGLDADEIELLADSDDVAKLSSRDLAIARVKRSDGATTVAATAHLAHLAGVKVFATGGLGGVHRGARESWDVSADLAALARTPVAVVCSGVKSILDVPATLEYLETLGVPVVGYGSRRFAGFYLTDSGEELDWSVSDEGEAAGVILASGNLGPGGAGLIISNALPEQEQLDPELHGRVLEGGLSEAARLGVRGKEVTPFLLSRFRDGTGGDSLRANKELVRRNVRLAARIAARVASNEGASG